MTKITIQIASEAHAHPSSAQLRKWAKLVLQAEKADDKQITFRVADADEVQHLNLTYRHKDKPTNVLSFPMDAPPGVQFPMLGDIILCSEVINHEAKTQGKSTEAHWAHMVVHGILHLLGFDHIEDQDAELMEAREIMLLNQLGFSDPYGDNKAL
ncbi:MAG: rRNA maturation RNase YbeY [Gammaproteobacteria bacterium]|nr:rRNA maturation RNase YbeY [Gammaproteobacteria bacterium]